MWPLPCVEAWPQLLDLLSQVLPWEHSSHLRGMMGGCRVRGDMVTLAIGSHAAEIAQQAAGLCAKFSLDFLRPTHMHTEACIQTQSHARVHTCSHMLSPTLPHSPRHRRTTSGSRGPSGCWSVPLYLLVLSMVLLMRSSGCPWVSRGWV